MPVVVQVKPVVNHTPQKPITGILVRIWEKPTRHTTYVIPLIRANAVSPTPFNMPLGT